MAEYISVLLANGSTRQKVHDEMNDLVGSDFDPRFLEWLFDVADEVTRPEAVASGKESPSDRRTRDVESRPEAGRSVSGLGDGGRGRLLDSALGGLGSGSAEKRKADGRDDFPRKRMSEGVPNGPRGMGSEGRSLQGRIGNRAQSGGGRGMPIRGAGRNQPAMGGMNGGMGGGVGAGMGMGGMGESSLNL